MLILALLLLSTFASLSPSPISKGATPAHAQASDENNEQPAALVIGQTSFTTSLGANCDSPTTPNTATTLCDPSNLAFDSQGNLWVSDTHDERVLEYNAPFSVGEAAGLELGQPSFSFANSIYCPQVSRASICEPGGLAFDPQGNLWVADTENGRVLGFAAPFSDGEAASIVIGQPNFTSSGCVNEEGSATILCAPEGIAFDSQGNLWVVDDENMRVVEFTAPLHTGEAASVVLGQPNLTSHGGCYSPPSASSLCYPNGIAFDSSGNLWLADTNDHRVLEFATPFSDGEAANLVVGQSDFTSNSYPTSGGSVVATPTSLFFPENVAFDFPGDLWVTDGNSRVVGYAAPISDGEAASYVIGQPDLTTTSYNPNSPASTSLSSPYGLAFDSMGNLWVVDNYFGRVLEYPSVGGQPPAATSIQLAASPDVLIQGATDVSTSITAMVLDQYGNPMPGLSISFTSSLAGTFSPSDSVTTDQSGQVSVGFTAQSFIFTAGAQTITASAPGIAQSMTLYTYPSPSCTSSSIWMHCNSFNVNGLTVPFAQVLDLAVGAYDAYVLSIDPLAPLINPIQWNELPSASVYLVGQSSPGQLAYAQALQEYFGIVAGSGYPTGYVPQELLVLQFPVIQSVNALLNTNYPTGMTVSFPSSSSQLFVNAHIQGTQAGYIDFYFLVSSNPNASQPQLVSGLVSTLAQSVAQLVKGGNAVTTITTGLQTIYEADDLTIGVVTSDLTTAGPLQSYVLTDLATIISGLNAYSAVSGDYAKMINVGTYILEIPETGPVLFIPAVRAVVTSLDLAVELIQQGNPSSQGNEIFSLFANALNISTTFIDPPGTTVLPSIYNASNQFVLGYNPATGGFVFASSSGMIFADGGGYIALLSENDNSPTPYTEVLNSVTGTSPEPYVTQLISYNPEAPVMTYAGMVPAGGSVPVGVAVNSQGIPAPQQSLLVGLSKSQESNMLTVTATGTLSDGTPAEVTQAFITVEGTQSQMSQTSPDTFTAQVSLNSLAPEVYSVYMIAPNLPGGYAEGVVNQIVVATTTSVSCSSPAVVGTTSSCTATVMGAYADADGETVSFSASGSGTFSSSGSCAVTAGSCAVTYTPTSTSGSPQTISATYSGDAYDLGSSGAASISVSQASTTVAASCTPPSVVLGIATTCTAAVSGSFGLIAGDTVTFSSNGAGTFAPSTTCTIGSGTSCSVNYTPSSVGTGAQTITAAYSGDEDNAASSGSTGIAVSQQPTSTSVSCSPTSLGIGATSSCTAAVSGAAGTIAGETITLSQAGGTGAVAFPSPATCTLSGTSCQIALTGSSGGPVTLLASYPGDSTNGPSSGTASLTIRQATTTAVSCTQASIAVSATSKCTATVSGEYGSVAGETVTFSQTGGTGGVALPSPATCTLVGSSCSVAVTGSSQGSATVQAAYPGDGNNGASSGTATLTVTEGTTSASVSCTPSSFAVGATSSCKATVSGAAGAISGETVSFAQTGGTGSVKLPSPPTCTLSGTSCQVTVTGAAAGAVTIKATYGGDAGNMGSSGTVSLTVTRATTTTSLSCSPASFGVAATSSCKATVSGAGGVISGEKVTFSQTGTGSVTLPSPATCALSGNACTITVTGASPGPVTLTATFGGDANDAGSSGGSAATVTYKSCPQVPNKGGQDLSGENLEYCNLAGYNLSGDNLQYANLQYADLQGASLLGANLAYADLSDVSASGANLLGANLQYADLQGGAFATLSFVGAALQYANMSYGDFNYANFTGAATYGANITGATFVGATDAP